MIRRDDDHTRVEQVERLQLVDQLADQEIDELHLQQIALLVVANRPGVVRPQLSVETVNTGPGDAVGASRRQILPGEVG